MDIQEIQKRVVDFHKQRARTKNFKITAEQSLIHLIEEVGEVARQLSNKEMRPEVFDEENLKEEIIDVILVALILADTCKVDVDKGIEKKLESLFKRHGFTPNTIN